MLPNAYWYKSGERSNKSRKSSCDISGLSFSLKVKIKYKWT